MECDVLHRDRYFCLFSAYARRGGSRTAPTLLPSMIEHIYVLGSYAYVMTNAADLRIIDI